MFNIYSGANFDKGESSKIPSNPSLANNNTLIGALVGFMYGKNGRLSIMENPLQNWYACIPKLNAIFIFVFCWSEFITFVNQVIYLRIALSLDIKCFDIIS